MSSSSLWAVRFEWDKNESDTYEGVPVPLLRQEGIEHHKLFRRIDWQAIVCHWIEPVAVVLPSRR